MRPPRKLFHLLATVAPALAVEWFFPPPTNEVPRLTIDTSQPIRWSTNYTQYTVEFLPRDFKDDEPTRNVFFQDKDNGEDTAGYMFTQEWMVDPKPFKINGDYRLFYFLLYEGLTNQDDAGDEWSESSFVEIQGDGEDSTTTTTVPTSSTSTSMITAPTSSTGTFRADHTGTSRPESTSDGNDPTSGSGRSSGLSVGAQAGIGVGVGIAGLIAIAAGIIWWRSRQRKAAPSDVTGSGEPKDWDTTSPNPAELYGNGTARPLSELPENSAPHRMSELPGDRNLNGPVELA